MLLYPQPKSIGRLGKAYDRPQKTICFFVKAPSDRLKNAVRNLGFTLSKRKAGSNLKIDTAEPALVESEYTLTVKSGKAEIVSRSEFGAFYGLITLKQILEACPSSIPNVGIRDWPDLMHRGYMLDISRCKVPTMETLFELVDFLASLKYNQLQLYTEHVFAYSRHERIWADSSPLTANEIRELDQYCYDRYIELVPNQNSFGHMERWLRHDAYKSLAECPKGFEHPFSGWKPFGSTLKPTVESANFMGELYDELLPNFRSRNLNIGGDEPWELGRGASKSRVAELGKHEVYLEHLLRLHELVRSRGHGMQFWGDIMIEQPELARELPKEITALLWGYEADHPFKEQCEAMQASKTGFYVVPGTSTWNSIGGRLNNAYANIESAVYHANMCQAKGLLLADWGDNGHHQSRLLSLPPILYAAGGSWDFNGMLEPDYQTIAVSFLPKSVTKTEYETIVQLSDISVHFKKPLHNATWLNRILFSKPDDHAILAKELSLEELQSAKSAIKAIQATGELELSRKLLAFAAKKGIAIVKGHAAPSFPVYLLNSFRKYWLRENRPGGLDESVRFLTDANP